MIVKFNQYRILSSTQPNKNCCNVSDIEKRNDLLRSFCTFVYIVWISWISLNSWGRKQKFGIQKLKDLFMLQKIGICIRWNKKKTKYYDGVTKIIWCSLFFQYKLRLLAISFNQQFFISIILMFIQSYK